MRPWVLADGWLADQDQPHGMRSLGRNRIFSIPAWIGGDLFLYKTPKVVIFRVQSGNNHLCCTMSFYTNKPWTGQEICCSAETRGKRRKRERWKTD